MKIDPPQDPREDESLDPEIRAMLALALSQPGGGVGDLPLDEARAAYRSRYRSRGIVVDREVRAEDVEIPGPAGAMRARLYRAPQGGGGRLTLYLHGGGYMLGDIEAYDAQSRMIAALSGADLLFPEYRLAPEHPFPAAANDAGEAARWLVANAGRLGADPARIVAAGDSAGAALAIAASRAGAPFRALLLLYPAADFRPFAGSASWPSLDRFGRGYFLDRSLMELFARRYLAGAGVAEDPRASPILAPDLGSLPPTRIIVPSHDPLRDMGEALGARIREAGGDAKVRRMEGMVHNFMGHAGVSAGARRAFIEVASTLRGLFD
ncbi:MAG: alpha/beta hydrolase [Pikeienuella sp.]|uniref:alpha/beta hydrolase n=1 Tax=Pikeienuella sp. TaxID=2831957 RepID=UPI00391AEBB6